MPIRPVDWRTIHSRPLIAVPDCWKLCGGGFCCANSHPDFQFRLMPPGGAGTVVIYLEDEYAWMRANGHIVCGEEHGASAPAFEFDFGGPRPLVLRHSRCSYLGRCAGAITKPLLCRAYPFMPVFGLDGALEDVLPASIIDATLHLKEGRRACPIDDRNRLEAALVNDVELLAALRHPYIVFHTQAAAAFMESYRERLLAWEGFHHLSGPGFWQAWEMAYLGRRLVDRDAVATRILSVYNALTARHGQFLEKHAEAVL
ncbi:MAG: hypothetical protein WBX25_05630 [Rhodomicrobium sp.]